MKEIFIDSIETHRYVLLTQKNIWLIQPKLVDQFFFYLPKDLFYITKICLDTICSILMNISDDST